MKKHIRLLLAALGVYLLLLCLLSNPPLRCTLRVLCSLSFWDTHGAKQLHLLQAYSRLPRQS